MKLAKFLSMEDCIFKLKIVRFVEYLVATVEISPRTDLMPDGGISFKSSVL